MTSTERRAWLYAVAWLGGGVAAGAFLGWLIWIIAYDPWPKGTEEQRLGILGQTSLGALVLMGLVMLGLSIRNAIRNIKGSAGPVSFEASGESDAAAGAQLATDAAQGVVEELKP
jgi:hypothetical protein